jgi:hypothetical protein
MMNSEILGGIGLDLAVIIMGVGRTSDMIERPG